MKVAVLDLGTNVFNLLLCMFEKDGCRVLCEFKRAARLGAGGLSDGYISEKAFDTASDALSAIMTRIRDFGGADLVLPYATSAVRDARNGRDFAACMNEKFGIEINVISGDREAGFIFRGIMESLPEELKTGGNILMLDIGGGSNEFVISDGRKVLWKRSFPIGMARMREMFGYADPLPDHIASSFTEYCNGQLEPLWREVEKYSPVLFVGSSGSFDTFRDLLYFNLSPELPYRILEKEKLDSLHETLLASNSQQRLSMPGMSPIRVDYIVLASLFTKLVLDRVKPGIICQSSYSLKEGAMAICYDSWLKNGKIV